MSEDNRSENTKIAVERIHDLLQQLMNEGILTNNAIVQSWYMILTGIDRDGDDTITILADSESRTMKALGMVRFAEVLLEDEVRAWGEGD